MSEELNDILREMRKFANTDSQSIGRDVLRRDIQHFANRIEAAHKREREATCKESLQVGNVAAMREALRNADIALSQTSNGYHSPVRQEIKEALSTPPRNCDKYATLDDARNAFFADYVPDETCSSATAFATWLFDKAKGETK